MAMNHTIHVRGRQVRHHLLPRPLGERLLVVKIKVRPLVMNHVSDMPGNIVGKDNLVCAMLLAETAAVLQDDVVCFQCTVTSTCLKNATSNTIRNCGVGGGPTIGGGRGGGDDGTTGDTAIAGEAAHG